MKPVFTSRRRCHCLYTKYLSVRVAASSSWSPMKAGRPLKQFGTIDSSWANSRLAFLLLLRLHGCYTHTRTLWWHLLRLLWVRVLHSRMWESTIKLKSSLMPSRPHMSCRPSPRRKVCYRMLSVPLQVVSCWKSMTLVMSTSKTACTKSWWWSTSTRPFVSWFFLANDVHDIATMYTCSNWL